MKASQTGLSASSNGSTPEIEITALAIDCLLSCVGKPLHWRVGAILTEGRLDEVADGKLDVDGAVEELIDGANEGFKDDVVVGCVDGINVGLAAGVEVGS
jgi:hypothetical protein